MKTAQASDTLATYVMKKIVDIRIVGNPDLTEKGGVEGATDLQKNWKVLSGALIYEGRIYKKYKYDYQSCFQSWTNDH